MAVTTQTQDNPVVANAIKKVGELSTLPEVTQHIIEVVEDPRSDAKDLHEIIKHDVALSSRILKVVNSAFYGLPGQVSSVDRAIVLLGLSAVKNIAIAASIGKMFRGQKLSSNYTSRDLWRHSLAAACACRQLHKMLGTQASDEAFLMGLIHDIGFLVAQQTCGDQLAEAIDAAGMSNASQSLREHEKEIVGATHEEFGAALTAKWKFPLLYQATVGFHHRPFDANEKFQKAAATVYVGDLLAAQLQLGFDLSAELDNVDQSVLDLLGITEQQLQEIAAVLPEDLASSESVMSGS